MIKRFVMKTLVTVLTLLGYTHGVVAQDKAVLVLSDTITGNQEQPKVLYIVPWKSAEDNTLLYQPLSTRLQRDVFGHVEREEHLRELGFRQQLQGESKTASEE